MRNLLHHLLDTRRARYRCALCGFHTDTTGPGAADRLVEVIRRHRRTCPATTPVTSEVVPVDDPAADAAAELAALLGPNAPVDVAPDGDLHLTLTPDGGRQLAALLRLAVTRRDG